MAGLALVTGANGFVGSHLVELLLREGWTVRALVRRTSRLDALPVDRLQLAYGEMTDASSLDAAVTGVDTVFHVAGATRAPNYAAYLAVNADGTRALAAAASRAAVRRFVLVSSLAAGGPSAHGAPRSEEAPDAPRDLYGKSKHAGEVALREVASAMPWTILRPCAVYGPRDVDFLKLATLVRRGWRLEITGSPQEVSVIHVGDLAQGIVRSAHSAASAGRTYYLAHPVPVTWPGICEAMGKALARNTRPFHVPRQIILPVASLIGGVARMLGQPSPLPRDRVEALLAPAWTCSTLRATQELEFTATMGLEDGMRETIAWYAEQGLLGSRRAVA